MTHGQQIVHRTVGDKPHPSLVMKIICVKERVGDVLNVVVERDGKTFYTSLKESDYRVIGS